MNSGRRAASRFELLGRDVEPGDPQAALEALDRALVFIGGGIGALRA